MILLLLCILGLIILLHAIDVYILHPLRIKHTIKLANYGWHQRTDKIRELAKTAFSSDPFTRHAAMGALARMGRHTAPITDKLLKFIKKYPNEGGSRYAVICLSENGQNSQEIIDVLARAITLRDFYAPKEARELLEKLQPLG